MIAGLFGWLIGKILPGVIGNLADDVVTGLFGLLQTEITRRNNIAQGRAEQHATDDDATIKEAQDAQKVSAHVDAESDAALNSDLERVRRDAAAGRL